MHKAGTPKDMDGGLPLIFAKSEMSQDIKIIILPFLQLLEI